MPFQHEAGTDGSAPPPPGRGRPGRAGRARGTGRGVRRERRGRGGPDGRDGEQAVQASRGRSASTASASSARQMSRSGSHGSGRLYRRGLPSRRDTWSPAAAATATGAAESHSYGRRVSVDVGVAPHHGHAWRRPSHRHQLAPEPLGQHLRVRKRAGPAHQDARRPVPRVGDHRRIAGRERGAQTGQRDRTGGEPPVDDEGDVHGPVGARGLGELARAVEGVDYPDPPRVEAARVVGGLFRQDAVAGEARPALRGEETTATPVAFAPELAAVSPPARTSSSSATRFGGQLGGGRVVGGGERHGRWCRGRAHVPGPAGARRPRVEARRSARRGVHAAILAHRVA